MPVWRPLASPLHVKGNPTLLIWYQRRNDGYRVLVTDLTYLWVEDLDRRNLIKRALNDETEIDPSLSNDQLELLLRHIVGCLERDPDTSMAVTSTSQESNDLTLQLKAKLAPPLKELQWSIHLKRASQYEFSKEVVLPILGELYSTTNAIPGLYKKLREKDDVISRMKGTLSNMGHTVSDIWRDKRSTQKVSEDQIPGLALFDQGAWQQGLNRNATIEPADLRQKLFRTGLAYQPVRETIVCTESWWQDLGDGLKFEPKEEALDTQPPGLLPHESSKGFESHDSPASSTEDDLPPPKAVQSTKSSMKDKAANSGHGSDTDATASDLGEPALKARKRTRSASTSSASSSKLGSNEAKPTSKASPSSATLQPALSPKPMSSKPASKLGRIGGSQKPSSRCPSAVPSVPANLAKQKAKIGQIGGAKKVQAGNDTLSQSDQLPSRKGPAGKSFAFDADPEQEVKETEIERANRRREALKEERQNAGPAKKKKKF